MGDMSREPSMEDILSSIRRVIARDEATVQARMARVGSVDDAVEFTDKPAENVANKPDVDIVEKITLSPHGAAPSPLPAQAAPDAPVAVPPATAPSTTVAPEVTATQSSVQSSASTAPSLDETLISNASAEAARQSLESLNTAFALSPNLMSGAISSRGRTIDDVVMEALRPMLKTWLDQNLPPIVEAMVAKEIRRITGQR